MVTARIFKTPGGGYAGFDVSGHADYRKHGRDIVCAGVSAVCYTAAGSLEEMAGARGFTEEDGHMSFMLPVNTEKPEIAQILLQSMEIGLQQIEFTYPKYIRVLHEEV